MNVLAWPLTIAVLGSAYPWARLALIADGHPRRASPLLTALVTLGLSLGILTLAMLACGLLALPIDWRTATAACAAVSLLGLIGWGVAARRINRPAPIHGGNMPEPDRLGPLLGSLLGPLLRLSVAVTAIIAVLIVFNAIYWPFGIDDSVAIYAWYGKLIARAQSLPPLAPGSLYEAYPMLLPLAYAFTHQAAGWVNEYLAALIPALLSVGVMGLAYLIGQALYRRWVGILAALLCALTPAYTFWASASYADLPCGFFYGLSGLFAWRAMQGLKDARSMRSWLLAGIFGGLAAWTKNSGLWIIFSLGAWWALLLALALQARTPIRPLIRAAALMAAGFGLVVVPWYGRNLLLAGVLVPATGWTYAAQRTVLNLFPYLVNTRYLPTGIAFTAGLAATVISLARAVRRPPRAGSTGALPAAYLLIFFGPFFAVWWILFSYDPRFLLVVFPFVAVMGGKVLADTLTLVATYGSRVLRTRQQQRFAGLAAGLALVILALPAASTTLDHKTEMFRHLLMSDAEKHAVRLGDRYTLAVFLRDQVPGSRVWTQDQLLPYHADGVTVFVGPPPAQDDLRSFDYWVASPGDVVPAWLSGNPVYTAGAYRLYAVRNRP